MSQLTDLPYIAADLRPLAVPLPSVQVDPANVRKHDDRNIDAIKTSLKRYGQRKPIVVNRRTNFVIAGNGTWHAARLLDWQYIAAVFVDDDEMTATGYAIADNRTAELADWDDEALLRTLQLLRQEDQLAYVGFGVDELDQLLRSLATVTEDTPIAQLSVSKRVSPGQVWQVGRHRLMCGDSANPADVARLTAGVTVDAVVTDPPYDMPGDAVLKIVERFAPRAMLLSGTRQAFSLTSGPAWKHSLDFVWVHRQPRSTPAMTRPVYHHNNIVFITRGNAKRGWKRPQPGFASIIEVDGTEFPREGLGHAKPVALFLEMLRGFSWRVWADPFAGTGVSLIACELLERTCFALERDPAVADLALARCERAGLKAELIAEVADRQDTAAIPTATHLRVSN